jgi:hypothetical protein
MAVKSPIYHHLRSERGSQKADALNSSRKTFEWVLSIHAPDLGCSLSSHSIPIWDADSETNANERINNLVQRQPMLINLGLNLLVDHMVILQVELFSQLHDVTKKYLLSKIHGTENSFKANIQKNNNQPTH